MKKILASIIFFIFILTGLPLLADTLNDMVFCPSNDTVWGINPGGNEIIKYNIHTGAVMGNYTVTGAPCSAAYEEANKRLWVSQVSANTVSTINPDDGSVIQTCNAGDGAGGVAYDPVNQHIWVSNNHTNSITEMELDCTIVDTHTVDYYPALIVFDPYSNSMWAGMYQPTGHETKNGNNIITKINVTTKAVSTYTVGTGPYSLTIEPIRHQVWVGNYEGQTISIIDIDSGTVISTFAAAFGGQGPNAMVYSTFDQSIYAAYCCNSALAERIDPATHIRYSTGVAIGANAAYDYHTSSMWGTYAYVGVNGVSGRVILRKKDAFSYSTTDTYTKLLIHFDAQSGYFRDFSQYQNIVLNNGITYDASGKFGGRGTFSGGDLQVPYSSSLNPGTGDFSIDTWVDFTSLGSYNTLIGQSIFYTMVVHLYADGTLYLGVGGVGYQSSSVLTVPTDGSQHHLEISRTSGVVYVFWDGKKQTVSGSSNSTSYVFSNENNITIGSQNGVNKWGTGHMDEFRYRVGVGGHTENFTPPTAPYSNYGRVIMPIVSY